MQKVVGSNPTENEIWFSNFTLSRMKSEELYCKTNIKLLKLIKIWFRLTWRVTTFIWNKVSILLHICTPPSILNFTIHTKLTYSITRVLQINNCKTMLNCKPKIIVYVSCIKNFSIFGSVYVSIYTIHDVFVYRVPNSILYK